MNKWLLFNVGCIECGVGSNVVGVFDIKEEADKLAERLYATHHWRQGGQNSYEVFPLPNIGDPIPAEYLEE